MTVSAFVLRFSRCTHTSAAQIGFPVRFTWPAFATRTLRVGVFGPERIFVAGVTESFFHIVNGPNAGATGAFFRGSSSCSRASGTYPSFLRNAVTTMSTSGTAYCVLSAVATFTDIPTLQFGFSFAAAYLANDMMSVTHLKPLTRGPAPSTKASMHLCRRPWRLRFTYSAFQKRLKDHCKQWQEPFT